MCLHSSFQALIRLMHRLSELELPSYISQHFTPTLTQIAVKPLLKVCLVLTFTAHPHHAVEKGMWGAMEQEEERSKWILILVCPSLLQSKSQRTSSVAIFLSLFSLMNNKGHNQAARDPSIVFAHPARTASWLWRED